MSNQLPPNTIPQEYTRGTGPFFPSYSTVAASTTEATAASTAATAQSSVTLGTTFPANPTIGQQFYRTDLAALYLWTGTNWVAT